MLPLVTHGAEHGYSWPTSVLYVDGAPPEDMRRKRLDDGRGRGTSARMKATIWHNPRCSKSREALGILTDAGAEVTVVEYLKTPPSRDELARVYAKGGIAPRDALRKDAPAVADDAAALDLMARTPATIERPVVETAKGVRIGRPPEAVREIL